VRLLANWVNSWKPKLHNKLFSQSQPKAGIILSYGITKVQGLFLFCQPGITPLIFFTSDPSNEQNAPSNSNNQTNTSNEQTVNSNEKTVNSNKQTNTSNEKTTAYDWHSQSSLA
jgi:hypothetical protein